MAKKESDIKYLAGQLQKPSGQDGIKTGKKLFENNGPMIRRAIDLLACSNGELVVETGHGNGAHLDYLFDKAANLQYAGVEVSETMHREAIKNNQEKVETGKAAFFLGEGVLLPLPDAQADRFFTVNTIYFWKDIPAILDEVKRILKPGGTLCIALVSRDFMKTLPFAQYGFRLFHPGEVKALLEEADFTVSDLLVEKEIVGRKEPVERELIIALARKH